MHAAIVCVCITKGAVTTALASTQEPQACDYAVRVPSAHAGRNWQLVLYADGLTPGAVLSPDNRRKSVIWYATILELYELLSHEEFWVTVAVARIAFCHMHAPYHL